MYRLVCIDIDGTLLTSQNVLSQGTLSAVERVTNINKVPVVLTAARPPQAVERIYAELGLSCPAICFNGALVLNKCRQEDCSVMQSFTIDGSHLTAVDRIAAAAGTSVHYYKAWQWLTQKRDDWTRQEEVIINKKAMLTDTGLEIETWTAANDGPHKILLMGTESQLESARHLLQKDPGDNLAVYKSKPTYLEITNRQASKAFALSILLKKYGLTPTQAIAIGDQYNDIAMLQLAGLGIAMANAPDDVKDQADFITTSNDEEGIKLALDKFIA